MLDLFDSAGSHAEKLEVGDRVEVPDRSHRGGETWTWLGRITRIEGDEALVVPDGRQRPIRRRLRGLSYCPTPDELAERADAVRLARGLYAGDADYVGCDGPAIAEYVTRSTRLGSTVTPSAGGQW